MIINYTELMLILVIIDNFDNDNGSLIIIAFHQQIYPHSIHIEYRVYSITIVIMIDHNDYPLVNVYIVFSSWVNQLFRLGHGFNSKLFVITIPKGREVVEVVERIRCFCFLQ